MANFQACPSCARHIKAEEALCPFCGARTPDGFASIVRAKGPAPISRAAILFMGATAMTGASVACSSSSSSGGHTVTDAGGKDTGVEDTGSAVAAYGPAIIDSSVIPDVVALYGPAPVFDAGPDTSEFDGPVAAYGPAPIPDGGEG